MNMVESSKEDDDLPSMESVTSQYKSKQSTSTRLRKESVRYVLSFWISKMQLKTRAVIRRKNGPELYARQKKAVKIFPRPTAGPLRPIVHGQTVKYNVKVRSGRCFSLEEIKLASFRESILVLGSYVTLVTFLYHVSIFFSWLSS